MCAFVQAAPCALRLNSATLVSATRGVPQVYAARSVFLGQSSLSCKSAFHVMTGRPSHDTRVRTTPTMEANKSNDKPTAQDLAKLYGGSYLGTSIGLSIISYAVLYALVYVGVDVRGITNAFGNWLATTPLGRPSALDNVSDAAGAAAIAYVAHKVASPLRFPLTIAATPFVARIFSKKSVSNDSGPPPNSS